MYASLELELKEEELWSRCSVQNVTSVFKPSRNAWVWTRKNVLGHIQPAYLEFDICILEFRHDL